MCNAWSSAAPLDLWVKSTYQIGQLILLNCKPLRSLLWCLQALPQPMVWKFSGYGYKLIDLQWHCSEPWGGSDYLWCPRQSWSSAACEKSGLPEASRGCWDTIPGILSLSCSRYLHHPCLPSLGLHFYWNTDSAANTASEASFQELGKWHAYRHAHHEGRGGARGEGRGGCGAPNGVISC